MYKSKHNIYKRNCTIRRFALFLVVFMLFCGIFSLFNYPAPNVFSADDTTPTLSDNQLQNGSFEEEQTWTSSYSQPDQSAVPAWNTTAFQGKIELFKKNTGVYIKNVTLEPTDGDIAAELNADEESTLYQNVKTSPSSVYEWGLDHGARNGTDTMALVIGPKQSVNPSKPSKAGRDHFMQMVDWLISQGETSVKTSAGLGEHITLYSKKFAASGAFEDNAGNNAFSLTPSTIYTEEWHIWIMASSSVKSGTNPWNSYGSNDKSNTENESGTGGTSSDLNKYYHYTVPAGQTETVFGFVSVGYVDSPTTAEKAKTYGNFLDNINFKLYHPLSGSTTTHGSAVIGGSDGTTEGEGGSEGHKVTIDDKLAIYVEDDGKPLKIQAIVKKDDADNGCEFVGLYYTKQGSGGNPETVFLKLAGNEIEDTGSLTDEQKKGKWVKSTNTDGDIIYTYYLEGLNSAADLHFLFIKNPTITYDTNGGKPYKVNSEYNKDEAENVYSFKPVTGTDGAQAGTGTLFIDPYKSHSAEGQNDSWKFMGWLLTGDNVDNVSSDIQVNADKLGSLLLPAEHTVACDYNFNGVNEEPKAQYFKIYEGKDVVFTKTIKRNDDDTKDVGVTWNDKGETIAYANVHKGLTMVAQWRWQQAFIPQTHIVTTIDDYEDSNEGGTVEIISVTDKSDTNYIDNYNDGKGGKAYYAETDEKVTVKATANEGYSFVGWYDEKENLVSTNAEYSYIETKESINTYYARFSNSVTQTYIRQIKNGDTWEDTTDDKIGILGRYIYTDAVGTPISSTATAKSGYKFVGWYDSNGTKISDDMLTNDGATISYTTTGDATYYARFEKTITQKYIRQVKNGENWDNTTDNDIGTLTINTHTDVVGTDVSSTAKAGSLYNFIGWYDSSFNEVSSDMLKDGGKTISYTTTVTATYYARFSKKIVTQTYIRQVRNGDTWENTTNNDIGTLDTYSDVGEIDNPVSSTATAGYGYKFVGWYDSEGNEVGDDMLKEDDPTTISYTTTGNATYYARFEKVYTLNVGKIDGSNSTEDNKVPLEGAEFTLYQEDSTGNDTIDYNGASIQCTVVGTGVTALREDGTATAVFEDMLLSDKEYYLVETNAPEGYLAIDTPLKITFDSSGNIAIIDETQETTGNEINVERTNYLDIHMPSSGTTFTGGWLTVAGFSLLALAAIGLFLIKISRFKQK